MQQETRAALMGRVSSTIMSIIMTAQVLGLIIAGAPTEATRVGLMFVLCAVFLLLLIVVGSRIKQIPVSVVP
jgi:hypothetical protein